MRPSSPLSRRRAAADAGFTLVELLVVIAIIGTLVALLLPAVQSARETARSNTCRNNIKQLCTALINYETTQSELPGLTNELADRGSAANANGQFPFGRRVSWVVMIFPYMELSPLWDRWSQEFDLSSSVPSAFNDRFTPEITNLQCPSDLPDGPGTPATNYVANAGQAFGDPSRGSTSPAGISASNREYSANGVFFDLNRRADFTQTGAAVPDGREGNPPLRSSMAYMQEDGTTRTMFVSENIHALWYTYPDSGQETTTPPSEFIHDQTAFDVPDAKHYFGFVWHNLADNSNYSPSDRTYAANANDRQLQRLNGARNEISPETLDTFDEPLGYPSSSHPQGVNVGFADGHVVFVSETIDLKVYAQMMTTKHKKSKYYDASSGVADRDLPQPSESDL